jgi:M6 family metalloprotease-like protein
MRQGTLTVHHTVAAILVSTALQLGGQSLSDFGYQRLSPSDLPATGAHAVAIVLMEYDSAPAANIAVAPPLAHSASEYYDLFFDFTQRSVNGYFMENSHGLLHLVPAGSGVYGPFAAPGSAWDLESPTDKSMMHLALALQNLASTGFNFADYDFNGDGVVTERELTVVVIDNIGTVGGANRRPNPYCFVYTSPADSTISVNVCPTVINVGHVASLMTYTHEISHQFGTVDLYGATGSENYEYTLMGATQFPQLSDRRTFHLDPWHKLLLGWTQPTVYSLDSDGSATLNAVQDGDPIILYSPSKGPLEYYMLEFRNGKRSVGAGYDADVNPGSKGNQSGLMIWHVQTNGIGGDLSSDLTVVPAYDQAGATMFSVYMLGGPTGVPGRGDLWGPGTTTAPLTWLDGNGRRVKVKVGPIVDNGESLQISWGEYPDPPLPMDLLFYNRTVDSGATGYITDANAGFVNTQSYSAGSLGAWTNIVGDASEIFWYDTHSGAGKLGQIDAGGNIITTYNLGRVFSVGWTHIVRHKGYLFFYNQVNGIAAVGNFQNGVFHQYNAWNSFSTNWTSIVSTPAGLLFYNSTNGSAAIGDWNIILTGTGFGAVNYIEFVQTAGFRAGSLSLGWTHIVKTPNGVLFYNAANGLEVMTDVSPTGISTRSQTVAWLQPGWTSIASDDTNLLFYDASSGDVAIANIAGPNAPGAEQLGATTVEGAVQIRRILAGYFGRGWSHIVPVAPTYPIK